MKLYGWDSIGPLLEAEYFECKLIFNASGGLFFPGARQHRDQKVGGLSYEDDYKGNALAAMVYRGRIEVRFHERFSDERVRTILRTLLQLPELAELAGWRLTYQGRRL